jgi:hypothetical protein
VLVKAENLLCYEVEMVALRDWLLLLLSLAVAKQSTMFVRLKVKLPNSQHATRDSGEGVLPL